MIEPRTNINIIEDMLEFLRAQEWSGQRNNSCHCHCHPEYQDCCPECYEYSDHEVDHNLTREEKNKKENRKHTADCRLASLILEANAVIDAEYEIQK